MSSEILDFECDAEYRCCKCGHIYFDIPGPTSCEKCGHIWVRWVNWDEWRKKHSKSYEHNE